MLFDADTMIGELEQLAASTEAELRSKIAMRLKAALTAGHAQAEKLLLKERHGGRCAARLCQLQDELIRVIYTFAATHLYPAHTPSEGEHMAVVATGGYGRGLMAPGSDIDLLFLLPYKQTAWGEQVAEAILYCLWDMGLKVGHATRSIDDCIRLSKSDMTIRTAILEARYLFGDRALFDELITRFDKPGGPGHRRRVRRPRSSPSGRSATAAAASRAIWSSRTSKTAKGGLRDLHTLFWIAKYVYRVRDPNELVATGVFDRPPNIGCSVAATIFSGPCAATCISSPATPRNGCRSTFSAPSPIGSGMRNAPVSGGSSAS